MGSLVLEVDSVQQSSESLDFLSVYDAWFDSVERWLRSLGAPHAELEDLAQEVFIVVRRKLDSFDGKNLAGWLYRICANTVSDHRRRAWFRRIYSRPQSVDFDRIESLDADPEQALLKKERQRALHRVLDRMSDKLRSTFYLHAVEGMSGEEIAQLTEVPVATVWSRLHLGRKQFTSLVTKMHGGDRS